MHAGAEDPGMRRANYHRAIAKLAEVFRLWRRDNPSKRVQGPNSTEGTPPMGELDDRPVLLGEAELHEGRLEQHALSLERRHELGDVLAAHVDRGVTRVAALEAREGAQRVAIGGGGGRLPRPPGPGR